ncbi:MAG TPA: hypothetical protein VFL14_03530 [Xanthomonadales bacterium]|nr:hypothetical protein [Xanthomonadales bacterium]
MAVDLLARVRRMPRGKLGAALIAFSIPLLLILLLLWWRIEAGAQRLLVPLRWFGDVSYESLSVGFDGTVRFGDLRFQPAPGMRGGPVVVERVEVRTPGLFWLLDGGLTRSVSDVADLKANLPPRQAKRVGDDGGWTLPPASQLAATFEDIQLQGEPPEIPGFEWLGFTSASPFESFGCGATRHWSHADLKAMGLSDTHQRMSVAYEAIAPEMADVTARLETDNASAAQFTLRLKVPDATKLMRTDWRSSTIALRSWLIDDSGFVMARNWFCARRANVSRLEFVEHHLSAIRRQLFDIGAVPAPALSTAYRRYVERGGDLSLESRPSGKLDVSALGRASPADRVRDLNAMLKTRGGPAVPFTLDFDAVKLAAFMGPPTLEEQLRVGVVPVPTPKPIVDAPLPAEPIATPKPSPTPVATPEPMPSPEPTQVAMATPTPGATAVPTPVASATPKPVAAPTTTPVAPVPAGTIPYAQLAKYVGRTITVRTTLGGRRTGVLLAHNPQAITLKLRHAREGELTLTIPYKTIRSATSGDALPNDGAAGAQAN